MTCTGCSARLGVACDIIAPSLMPVRAGDRVKTDRRDAKKLVRLYRAGELTFVAPPTPEQEGLRDLVRCRDDLRRARTAARHRVGKQLLRYGRIFREGKKAWTLRHLAWLRRQRLDDPLAQRALEHMLCHLDALDAQIAALDPSSTSSPTSDPWCDPVRWLCCFRGIGHADRARAAGRDRRLPPLRLPARADELPRPHRQRVLLRRAPLRGHLTKTGNRHARRLLVEAAWHYQHPPRRRSAPARSPTRPSAVAARAWQAQIRLHHRHRHLTDHGKRSTVATAAVARELCGFLWAAMTHQPLHASSSPPPPEPPTTAAGARRPAPTRPEEPRPFYAITRLATLVRGSSRPDTVLRSRPAHLRVTSRRCRRAPAAPPQRHHHDRQHATPPTAP